jgi:hypothetical protein
MSESTTELYSHADTCCFGRHSTILSTDMSQRATVSGFHTNLGELQCVVGSVAVAYDDPVSHQTYILVINQVLIFEDLEHNLVSPFQLRMNEIVVNDVPITTLVQTKDMNDIDPKSHSIFMPLLDLQIPLRLKGTTSYFVTRNPTQEELDQSHLHPVVVMTYESPLWDPNDPQLDNDEEHLRNQLGLYVPPTIASRHVNTLTTTYGSDHENLYRRLVSTVHVSIQATSSNRRKGTVDAAQLAQRWHISLDMAKRTIEKTTQRGVRDLAYRPLNARCYTDTMIAAVPSLFNKYTCAQIYVTEFGWVKVYPMRAKSEAPSTLDLLHHDYGSFREMVPDNAKELTSHEFRSALRKAGTVIKPIESYTPNQNKAEAAIRELKRMYRRAMLKSGAPEILWDHCFQLMCEIRSHMSLDLMTLEGETPTTHLLGDTADISHLCQFSWYEYVWWIDATDRLQNKKLGRYLGPSMSVRDVMCSKVLTDKATIRIHSSVFPLSKEDRNSAVVKETIATFEANLKEKLQDRIAGLPPDPELAEEELDMVTPTHDPYEPILSTDPSTIKLAEADDLDNDAHDKYLSAKVWLPDGDGILRHATVKRRKRDSDGHLIGKSNSNPLLDTSLYEVDFGDGLEGTYTANIIAENIFEQVDEEGKSHVLFDSIMDYERSSDALSATDLEMSTNGIPTERRTTKGWKFCVLWKDGSTSWINLKDLKEAYPVQLAEYAVAFQLAHEPAFRWWVPAIMRRRERIIKATKSRYLRKDQKFGIELPHSVKSALEIDRETQSTYWIDAIKKEMKAVTPAFHFLDQDSPPPIGHQKIPCHVVFDVNMEFTRKARFVAGGHKTEPPASITYASVVSRERVRIAFMVAALNAGSGVRRCTRGLSQRKGLYGVWSRVWG